MHENKDFYFPFIGRMLHKGYQKKEEFFPCKKSHLFLSFGQEAVTTFLSQNNVTLEPNSF